MSDRDDTGDLFDHAAKAAAEAAARAAKEEGMARAEANAAPGWSDTMFALVVDVAKRRPRFTADDVFDLADRHGVSATHDLRAFGPVMMRAARNGVCRKANIAPIPSRRVSLHASPRAVWDSLIFQGN